MKRLVLILMISLAGCASVQKTTRISSHLTALEFNSVASRYMDRPTFVSREVFDGGEQVLAVKMSTYGVDQYGQDNTTIRYSRHHANEYIQLIDKYLKWESLATKRNDAFTKDVGRASSWSNGMDAELKFVFHSGNAHQHYLAVSFCTALLCLDDKAQYYDKENAKELKNLLLKLKSNRINETDINDVYK
ncbi:hypothetical protein [Vibrio quintilis]|uniref:Lipoprotein n=1 Tax=Vibrio quintilis TaxID=1117707 RepID=A0A1M7Z1R3_9VIBR|nr:hypothetical protein [Vibrio quintilis]SHO58774.1 hypothetical protein VQ7734_04546 [Vibrio quintilis]